MNVLEKSEIPESSRNSSNFGIFEEFHHNNEVPPIMNFAQAEIYLAFGKIFSKHSLECLCVFTGRYNADNSA